MNPKISIIVPVYNVEQYLEKCIGSILEQSFTDFEIILVNDGSKDNSGVICDTYAERDDRISVIHKENGGLSSARNVGLDLAVGEYISFIDSDDWIDKEMFSILYNNSILYDADIVAGNIAEISKSGKIRTFNQDLVDILLNREQAMNELYLNRKLTYSACNKIYRRFLFDGLRYKEGIVFEDMDLSYKIIHKAERIFYTSKTIYFYRYNDESILRRRFNMNRVIEFDIKTEMYNFYFKNYPQFSNQVYGESYLTGVHLYSQICKYYPELAERYLYLIQRDKKTLATLIKDNTYETKKKLLIGFSLMFKKTFLKIYSYYYQKKGLI